jgi:hypothetical protein
MTFVMFCLPPKAGVLFAEASREDYRFNSIKKRWKPDSVRRPKSDTL